ncbi:MAG: hypothetical protein U0414_07980 [Polyangiaceae bacterium]
MRNEKLLLALFAAASVFGGCKGHHDALAPDGGAGGASASASKSASVTSSSSTGAGGEAPIQEPDVPTRFTFVNGVVDAPVVRFCFAPYPGGGPDRAPFPAAGLAFGSAYHAPVGTADVPASDALVLVITGTPPPSATCADLTSDPGSYPDVTLVEMGLVPAAAITMKRSFLVVADGCVGGVTHTDPLETQICGATYTPTNPTLGLAFLPMSLLDDEKHIAISYVNAVAAMTKANVWLLPGFDGVAPVPIVNGGPFGGAAPYPPNVKIEVSDVGAVSAAGVGSAVNPAPAPAPSANVPLESALAASGLSGVAVSNGRSLALVGIGAAPGTPPAADAWWKSYTVVAVDPAKVVTE